MKMQKEYANISFDEIKNSLKKNEIKNQNFIRNKNNSFFKYVFLFIIIGFLFISFFLIKIYKLFYLSQKSLTKQIEKFVNETHKLIKENLKPQFFNKLNYKKEYNLYRLLCPKKVIGAKKVLFGNVTECPYVLLDDIREIKIAYSFGIYYMISFDKALADKGIDVYMYDHTINKLVFENPKFHWKKIGVISESKKKQNKTMKTINELLIENGHFQEKNMILKIDIEYDEWDILNEISPEILKKFKYIILELHFWKIEEYELYINCLTKLTIYHQVFHIHCCNCASLLSIGDFPICNTLEVSYIIKEGNSFKKDTSVYPIKGFDYKSCPNEKSLDKEQIILQFCDDD